MRRVALITAVLTLVAAAPASADLTVFLGANTTPANRAVADLLAVHADGAR